MYTQPTTVVGGVYAYDNGYRSSYYQERRIYVAPQPRYYNQPRYYQQPRYYAPPPLPRYYQPGRPPGQAWSSPGRRHDGYRPHPGYRGDHRGGWRDDGHRGGRDRGWQRSGDYRRGDGRHR
ncbi:hypothetical protein [Pseudomonas sp. v388]|uniref:hypothetical protein n=1 Tax=Pseudomonas sp. v388 TaxID=2479849 RepID=UPI0015AC2721|nr:hypothetical protein [Pseudomonas sp. v388]